MSKQCSKCQGDMIKISPEAALDQEWLCLNQNCGHRERVHLFDELQKESQEEQK